MKFSLTFVLAGLMMETIGSQPAAGGKEAELEGVWTLTAAQFEGNNLPQLKGAVLEMKGGEKTFRLPGGELERGTYPNLPIFASVTLHNLYKEKGGMLAACRALMPFNDLVAVSYYPFFVGGAERLTALDWMSGEFAEFEKPFAMVETNDAAERLTFPKAGYVIEGTPAKQLDYYEKLLSLAQRQGYSFVISFVHQDYDALWAKIKDSAPELFIAWRDCGLLDEKGVRRPAFGLWRAYFEKPLAR